jgi:cell division protein FtsZ
VPPRRAAPPANRSRPTPALPEKPEARAAQAPANAPRPVVDAEAKAAVGVKAAQEEFGFGEVESRGHFEKTDRNLFDGQDLDVPTYLRKGIKISFDR